MRQLALLKIDYRNKKETTKNKKGVSKENRNPVIHETIIHRLQVE
jgi:hypothetical protein